MVLERLEDSPMVIVGHPTLGGPAQLEVQRGWKIHQSLDDFRQCPIARKSVNLSVELRIQFQESEVVSDHCLHALDQILQLSYILRSRAFCR